MAYRQPNIEDVIAVLETHPNTAFTAEQAARYAGYDPEKDLFAKVFQELRHAAKAGKVRKVPRRGHSPHSHMFASKQYGRQA